MVMKHLEKSECLILKLNCPLFIFFWREPWRGLHIGTVQKIDNIIHNEMQIPQLLLKTWSKLQVNQNYIETQPCVKRIEVVGQ